MADESLLLLLADAVLILHFAVVVFIVGGLALILVGNLIGWPWVNRRAFRVAHLAAMAVVTAEAWIGVACPLTSLEAELRVAAGRSGYAQGFVADWLQSLLFYSAPWWVFAIAYSAFLALVMFAWWRYPPLRRGGGPNSPEH